MILSLDPSLPVLWRGPHALQLGFDRPVARLEDLPPACEILLGALRPGASLATLLRLGREHDLGEARVREFLAAISGALREGHPAAPAPGPTPIDPAPTTPISITPGTPAPAWALAGGPALPELLRATADAGLAPPILRAGEEAAPAPGIAAAVIVSGFVCAPRRYAPWLGADIPHLSLTYGDRIIRVGPFIEPGAGPCLACLAALDTRRDPLWPTLATQVLAFSPGSAHGPHAPLARQTAAAALSARLLRGHRGLRARALEFDDLAPLGRTVSLNVSRSCACRAAWPEPRNRPGPGRGPRRHPARPR
ncbi:hypothetical protein [Mycetocola spongiae]|uniref:hypothetical protein n=1 Tax=Mycetocola spongiae TaxID=2859226 RepID=UPI001CF5A034|nr:hypothetical protein [Mycetocola spongiae]UCR89076.1 hypothetical protein KXZ72_14220 [Mycetocola spongiae]